MHEEHVLVPVQDGVELERNKEGTCGSLGINLNRWPRLIAVRERQCVCLCCQQDAERCAVRVFRQSKKKKKKKRKCQHWQFDMK